MTVLPINFIQCNYERTLFRLEEVYALDSLGLETVHYVDDDNRYVAQGRATIPQITEGLVTGCVDYQQTGYLQRLLGKLQ